MGFRFLQFFKKNSVQAPCQPKNAGSGACFRFRKDESERACEQTEIAGSARASRGSSRLRLLQHGSGSGRVDGQAQLGQSTSLFEGWESPTNASGPFAVAGCGCATGAVTSRQILFDGSEGAAHDQRLPDNHGLLKMLQISVEAEALNILFIPFGLRTFPARVGDRRWFIGDIL